MQDDSPSHWHRADYRVAGAPLYGSPVQSAITSHANGATFDRDIAKLHLHGFAVGGDGHDIVRVDVSIDGGKTWAVADLEKLAQEHGRTWAWTLWTASVSLPSPCPEALQVCEKKSFLFVLIVHCTRTRVIFSCDYFIFLNFLGGLQSNG